MLFTIRRRSHVSFFLTQAQVPSTHYVVLVCESLIQTYIHGAF
jgi:hypothetical protein